MRVDFEDAELIEPTLELPLIESICDAMTNADIVCIEDYNKGLLTPASDSANYSARTRSERAGHRRSGEHRGLQQIRVARPRSSRIAPKRSARRGWRCEKPEQFEPASQKLLQMLDLEAAIITLDRQGSYLATREGEHRWLKTRERQVTDGTGAGDMMLAMHHHGARGRRDLGRSGDACECGGRIGSGKAGCRADPAG